jgi:hypothetical protein
MKKIALTPPPSSSLRPTAYAGSDRFGSNNASQPAAPVVSADSTITTSIRKPDAAVHKPVPQGSNRNLFGNR